MADLDPSLPAITDCISEKDAKMIWGWNHSIWNVDHETSLAMDRASGIAAGGWIGRRPVKGKGKARAKVKAARRQNVRRMRGG